MSSKGRRPGQKRNRQPRADNTASCGLPQRCRAKELLTSLTLDELRVAVEKAAEPGRSNMLQGLGMSRSSEKRLTELLKARMAHAGSDAVHSILWVLSASPLETVASLLGVPEEGYDPGVFDFGRELRSGTLARWCEHWPPAVVRLTLEGLWDQKHVSTEERDALIALTEDPAALAAMSSSPLAGANDAGGCGDGAARARVIAGIRAEQAKDNGLEQPAPSEEPFRAQDGKSLDALIAGAVSSALATSPAGQDVNRLQIGLEWIISLDPANARWWGAYGSLVTALPASANRLEPSAEETRLAFLIGQLSALAHTGQSDCLRTLVRENGPLVERALDTPAGLEIAAAVVTARLEEPRDAVRLLARAARRPFPRWRALTTAVGAEAADLIEGHRAAEAELILRALEEALWRWSAGARGGEGTMGFEREAAGITLLRAACRRSRSDFVGAEHLLTGLDRALLDDSGRVSAFRESALAAAELSGLEQVRFSTDEEERVRLADRLRRARSHLEAAVDADPTQFEATLLLGVLAWSEHDDAGAARHLAAATPRLAEDPAGEPLVAAVRFHWGLAQLRLLEPGTDEGAYQAIEEAMAAGFVPAVDELISAAMALEAHGSPHAAKLLRVAMVLAPTDPRVTDFIVQRARHGDEDAGAAAEELAADRRLTLTSRFALLDAALAEANRRRDADAAERLTGEIEDVLIRAGQPELEERWAETLAANETLRLALEPVQADALRIGVLRRVGRLDEARSIARNLFYRAAAGDLRSFDAAELLELLREIGADEAELDDLDRLVREPPASEDRPDALLEPVRVIFVGGAEPQEQYRPHIAASIAERYHGRVHVDWFIPGWGSNWHPVAERVEAAYGNAHAVVLMVLVRTNFGRWVRRTAGEHGLPWVSCTGHGRASMERALDRAVKIASAQR